MKFTQPLFPICKRIIPLNGIIVALMLALSTAQAQPDGAPQVDETTQQAIKQVQQFMEFEMPKIVRKKQREVDRLEAERQRIQTLHQQRLSGNHSPKLLDLYQINSNGTVTDKALKLTWMRCSLGQNWTGRSCNGEAKEYKWEQAKKMAKEVRFAGHTDWRLPTINELKSLVYCSEGVGYNQCASGSQQPTLFQSLFPNTPATFYWSASPLANSSINAWGVGFYNGYGSYSDRDGHNYVRLVRSGH